MIETKRELEDWLNYEKMKYSIKWGGGKEIIGKRKSNNLVLSKKTSPDRILL